MQFAGRLVGNAQLRTTNSGKQVTGFGIAINRNYTAQDGTKVQQTTYFNCALWNRPNITEHLTKGMLVEVTGFPTVRTYTTDSGEARATIDFLVDTLDFLGGSKSNASGNNDDTTPVTEATEEDLVPVISDDDLPF